MHKPRFLDISFFSPKSDRRVWVWRWRRPVCKQSTFYLNSRSVCFLSLSSNPFASSRNSLWALHKILWTDQYGGIQSPYFEVWLTEGEKLGMWIWAKGTEKNIKKRKIYCKRRVGTPVAWQDRCAHSGATITLLPQHCTHFSRSLHTREKQNVIVHSGEKQRVIKQNVIMKSNKPLWKTKHSSQSSHISGSFGKECRKYMKSMLYFFLFLIFCFNILVFWK